MILLMTPPYHCGVLESAGAWPPLALATMAGHLRARGFNDVRIYDAMTLGHDEAAIEQSFRDWKPAYVCIGAYTSSVNAALRVLSIAKRLDPAPVTILGGVHATFMYEEVFHAHGDDVDFVVCGEGEETLAELVEALASGRPASDVRGVAFRSDGRTVVTPPRPQLDLDALQPAWDLLDWPVYSFYVMEGSRLGTINTSRGCSNECAFCSQQKFWGKSWRAASPARVMEDIRTLHATYGVDVFLISDEYPTRDAARWEEILDRLIQADLGVHLLMETCVSDIVRDARIMQKYRKAGVLHVYVGVEATSQATLEQFNKNIKVGESQEAIRLINDAGMVTETSFILGLPEETTASIEETLRLANYYSPDLAHFLALAPWPYADMYADLEPFVEDRDYAKYNLVEAVIKPRAMTLDDVNRAIIDCYRKFYTAKLREYDRITDPFKRHYLLTSARVMMKNSFLTRALKGMGTVPAEVEKYLRAGMQ
jgi:anaerobic magnesium-protoporphyrin IX monomethyl ester cyclase